MVVLRVLAFVAGATVAVAVLSSAMRTVVVPRAEPVRLTRTVFLAIRWLFELRVHRTKSWQDTDRIMARYAPTCLLALPLVWMTASLIAFTPMYWAVGVPFPRDSLTHSGSALLTLGFAYRHDSPVVELSFIEAAIGLALVALLISFLPAMYSQFSRRELLVTQLESRAGTPPRPAEMLYRAHRIGWLDQLDSFWDDWDRWFAELEETHTSYSALSFFRSPHHQRSWITAAGCVLDTAALRSSTVQLPRTYHAELCIRSGYLALRRVAALFDIESDPDPQPDDPISISKEEFFDVYEQLAIEGIAVVPDREQAWKDFAGWRVNYDTVLLGLCAVTMAPYAPWSSDRSPTRTGPPMIRRRRRRR
jgi:hypothetical protein